MADFTLVICSGKNEEITFFNKFIKRFFIKAYIIFKKPKPDDWIRKVLLYDNVNAYVINLPYSINELAHMGKKQAGHLIFMASRMCKGEHLIFPEYLSNVFLKKNLTDTIREGSFILRALLVTVLDEMFQKRGIEKSSLDITIIKGKSSEEFYAAVRLLSPVVKYITALVQNKEEIEYQIDEIFEDTGLCIGITNNLRSVIKSTDVIINLSNDFDWTTKMAKNPRVIVINCAEQSLCRMPCGNVVINGIHVRLPQEITGKIGKHVCSHFSELKLSEDILIHKLNRTHIEKADFADHIILKKTAEEFHRCGFAISGFIGRYGSIGLEDAVLNL